MKKLLSVLLAASMAVSLTACGGGSKTVESASTANVETTAKEERKLSYAEQKERDKILKKAQKAIDIAEQNVMQLEEKLAGIEEKLALGDTSAELLEQYASVQKEMENAMSMWEITLASV